MDGNFGNNLDIEFIYDVTVINNTKERIDVHILREFTSHDGNWAAELVSSLRNDQRHDHFINFSKMLTSVIFTHDTISHALCCVCRQHAPDPIYLHNFVHPGPHFEPLRLFDTIFICCRRNDCMLQCQHAASLWVHPNEVSPENPVVDRTCHFGWCRMESQLKKCGGCGLARYCSQEHQIADWKYHKMQCFPTQTKH